jgi:putative ferrous iron transport protein C
MILADVRDYLATRRRAPLADLTARFQVDADALRGMLEHWIRKGRLRRIDAGASACGGCCGCAEKLPEVYEWVDARLAR